jgi:Ca-activated chloride channel family protein
MQIPITFLYPWLLALIAAIPAFLWLRRRRQSAIGHSKVGMHSNMRSIPLIGRLPGVMFALAFAAIICALARPVLPEVAETRSIVTRDIIVATDISGSMSGQIPAPAGTVDSSGAETKTYRRLDGARDAVVEFVKARPGDRIGVMIFDDDSYWHWPLSEDHKIVIRKAELINSYTGGGTNFEGPSERARGTGPLQSSINHFREYGKAKSRVLVLVTDGEDSISDKRKAELTALMQEYGVKLYVLGVDWRPDTQNDLKKFTEGLGGKTFIVGSAGAMQAAMDEINRLETSLISVEKSVSYRDIYGWFLLAGLAFLTLFLGSVVLTREDA